MALALNNLKRLDMPLNKETKPNPYRRDTTLDKLLRIRKGDLKTINDRKLFYKYDKAVIKFPRDIGRGLD